MVAAKLPLPQKVTLKNPKDFQIIGKPVPRVDIRPKISDEANYGADIKIPGLLTAVIIHSPVYGGTVASLDTADALKVKGVHNVVQIDTGVAVVADNFWSAQNGKSALKIKWNNPASDSTNSNQIRRQFIKRLATRRYSRVHNG